MTVNLSTAEKMCEADLRDREHPSLKRIRRWQRKLWKLAERQAS